MRTNPAIRSLSWHTRLTRCFKTKPLPKSSAPRDLRPLSILYVETCSTTPSPRTFSIGTSTLLFIGNTWHLTAPCVSTTVGGASWTSTTAPCITTTAVVHQCKDWLSRHHTYVQRRPPRDGPPVVLGTVLVTRSYIEPIITASNITRSVAPTIVLFASWGFHQRLCSWHTCSNHTVCQRMTETLMPPTWRSAAFYGTSKMSISTPLLVSISCQTTRSSSRHPMSRLYASSKQSSSSDCPLGRKNSTPYTQRMLCVLPLA